MSQVWDVAVVGGGPGGAASATLLARAGFAVTLLDRAQFPREKPCAEYLSPESQRILAELGVVAAVWAAGANPLRGFRVFPPGGEPFTADFAARAAGVLHRTRGLALSRARLDRVLLDGARAAGAEVQEGVRVLDIGPDEAARRTLQTQGSDGTPTTVSARLIVAADGLRSVIGRRLGLLVPRRWPRRVALVGHLENFAGLGDYGEMHVIAGAYCGIAPFSGTRANVALVVPVAAAPHGRAQLWPYLRAGIERFPGLAGRAADAWLAREVLAIGPLSYKARRAIAPGVLLVGDAAGFYDPFTGEGMYRALRGAELLAPVAAAALQRGNRSLAALAPYERLRRREFAAKSLVERIIQQIIIRPPVYRHVGRRLTRRRGLADTLIGVTGDFLSPWQVLRPDYVARLFL